MNKCDLRQRKKRTYANAENVGRRKAALQADGVQFGEDSVVCEDNQRGLNETVSCLNYSKNNTLLLSFVIECENEIDSLMQKLRNLLVLFLLLLSFRSNLISFNHHLNQRYQFCDDSYQVATDLCDLYDICHI